MRLIKPKEFYRILKKGHGYIGEMPDSDEMRQNYGESILVGYWVFINKD